MALASLESLVSIDHAVDDDGGILTGGRKGGDPDQVIVSIDLGADNGLEMGHRVLDVSLQFIGLQNILERRGDGKNRFGDDDFLLSRQVV